MSHSETPHNNRLEELFAHAGRIPVENRAAWLGEMCAGEPELRKAVEELLCSRQVTGFMAGGLQRPEIEAKFARLKPEEAGDRIGHYKLLEQIGEGGFGIVWVAEQEHPVRRRVALKIIKIGMDTKEVMGRFDQERQALALMDHPNIAKVFDAGATDFGRPFFVMELVRGAKLTEYCDQARLSTSDRLKLFIAVCQAVQHAHQKGIIHRDLKPSNILVTLHDGVPVPKVIDFGVAKATQTQRLTDLTIYTRFEQMIGTPLYMSPEQAELSGLDIDTRSDIYSLGVSLYELLTGRTPIDQDTLAQAGIDEMRRLIREVDPPRPSARVKRLAGNELDSTATCRRTDPGRLFVTLRGDIDWIVMKCLEKDRTRRYDTANGLARDLERHLRNEVVTARPPTAGYLLSKLVRRNKVAFAGGAAILGLLVVAIVGTSWGMVRANRALNQLRAAAPAFVEQAWSLVAEERFDEAIGKLDYALQLCPDSADYLLAKADLLQCQSKLAQAVPFYRQALRISPSLERAEASAQLCEELLAAPLSKEGRLSRESLAKLHLAMQHQQRSAAELMPVARLLGEENRHIVDLWLARLKDLPIATAPSLKDRLTVRRDGRLALDLSGATIADLALLREMPLGALNLTGCKQITDFGSLRGFHLLTSLDLTNSGIADLSPLSGLPLEDLQLTNTKVFDLEALRGMKLARLSLRNTRVSDLSPIAGMPLAYFDATSIPASDYSPLSAAPLEECIIQNSPLNDLSFLRNSRVRELTLFGCLQARGFAVLADLKSLNLLILPQNFRDFPPDELAAISALRNHPALRNIQSEPRGGGGWVIPTTQSKDAFWREWNRDETFVQALRGLVPNPKRLIRRNDGGWDVDLRGSSISSLAALSGAPIKSLNIEKTNISDLEPLRGMALETLNISSTNVATVSPLEGMPLKELKAANTEITNLAPLRALPLTNLDLAGAPVTDLEPLRGIGITRLWLNGTRVVDLRPLERMPLVELNLNETRVADLSPLRGMPLNRLRLRNCSALTDLSVLKGASELAVLTLPPNVSQIEFLRALPKLERIGYRDDPKNGNLPDKSNSEFWTEYKVSDRSAGSLEWLSDACTRNPQDSLLALKLAAFQVWCGRDADYAEISRRMLQRAANTTSPETANQTAKLASLRPGADESIQEAALALAKTAIKLGKGLPGEPWCKLALGMAEYRRGHFPEAHRFLEEAAAAAPVGGIPYIGVTADFFRAMCLLKQGDGARARALFATTKSEMEPLPIKDTPPFGTHHDQIVVWLAHNEAKELLELNDGPKK